MKYVLSLLLCDGGCVLSMFGIGPGLVSMSPLRSSSVFTVKLFVFLGVLAMLCVGYFCLLVFVGGLGDL